MNLLQRSSLTTRLLVIQFIGLVLVVLAIGWFQLQTVRTGLLQQLESSGQNVLQTMQTILTRDAETLFDQAQIEPIVQELLREIPTIERISVIDPTFRIIADTDPALVGTITEQSALIEVVREVNELAFYHDTGGERFYRIGRPIFDSPEAATAEHVVAAISVDMKVTPIDELVARDFSRIMLVVGGLVLVYGMAIFWLVRANIARPLERLTAVTDEMGGGKLDVSWPAFPREDEIGRLTTSFKNMATQLGQTLDKLRQREQILEASVAINRRLSIILDERELLTTIVEQMQSVLNYYHAHIYLLDRSGKRLVMAGGTGEAGAIMLANGHSIPVGEGLVGRAAATNSVILAPDLSQEEGWLANPLLPDTKASLAVPIAVDEEILGVLNVQHNVVNGLQSLDADLITSIANQLAVTLQNVRAYAQVQERADQEALINAIGLRIERATTIEGVLDAMARELRRVVGAKHTIVELSVNPQQQNLSGQAGSLSEN